MIANGYKDMERTGEREAKMDGSVSIQAAEDNLVEAWACLAVLPEVAYDRSADRIRYVSGIDFPLCNSVMTARFPREELEARIREALEPSASAGCPCFGG
jgi:hypothetical protein